MGHKRKRILTLSVLGIAVLLLVLFLLNNEELLKEAGKLPLWIFFAVVATRLIIIGLNGLILKVLAAKFSIVLRFLEWFGLANVTTMTNYITPFSSGLLVRAAYLKRRHAFPYAQFMTTLAASVLLLFLVVGVVGFVVSIIILEQGGNAWVLIILFLLVTIAVLILLLLPNFELAERNRITQIINTSFQGWHSVRGDNSLVARLITITLVGILFNGLSYWIVYRALDTSISYEAVLIISLLPLFTQVLRITPANLGLQEAIVALSSELMGVGAELGLLVALILRAATIVPVVLLGSLFSYLLSRELGSNSMEKLTSTLDSDQPGP